MSEYIAYSGFAANPLEIFNTTPLEKFYHDVKLTTRDEFTKAYQEDWQNFIEFWTTPQKWEQAKLLYEDLVAEYYDDIEMINYQKPIHFYKDKKGYVVQGSKTAIMIDNIDQGTDEAVAFYSRNAAIKHLANYFIEIASSVYDDEDTSIPFIGNLLDYLHWLDSQDEENQGNDYHYFNNQNIIVEIRK